MAQYTNNRPEFPDRERPLYTPDTQAQQAVVARIAQAREGTGAPRGRGKKRGRDEKPKGAAVYYVNVTTYLPMGEHPQVTNEILGAEWGCGRTKAGELAKHPEKLDPLQERQLCRVCGVTREWLRYGGDNAFGKYETPDTVAAMYENLTNEDKALVCDLLTRLLGADTVRGIKDEQWHQDNIEWIKRSPAAKREVREIAQSIQRTAFKSQEPVRNAAKLLTDYYAKLYTADEWELIRQTADRLKSQGMDVDNMDCGELLAIARGEFVED